ncbi:nuclear transport factor 2 family protein [Mucilaginibacter sp. BJC16-A38]|uniref:nuclear transport factor 2 family protein n=1 Tax=Mucilaginibacter phenanthrenivorans TaxID=1234842 RepID=UPI002157EBF7|nr:nuclear transport factor 2 family protein [Mucilaginibacter phenanthrenivorans]MCR8557623.1 nuclear transport factor 2 family protein [Mucilaginibacter phenanthrenivorans]
MKNAQTIEESVAFYVKAWNEKEPEAIKAALNQCLTPDITYIDVMTPLVNGIEEFTNLILHSHSISPGRTFHLPKPLEAHNNTALYTWILRRPGKPDHYAMDFVEYNDEHKITRIVGFINPSALA